MCIIDPEPINETLKLCKKNNNNHFKNNKYMQEFILYYYYFMIVYNVIMQIFYENKSCLFEKILCCPKRKKYFGVMNFQDFGLRLLLYRLVDQHNGE